MQDAVIVLTDPGLFIKVVWTCFSEARDLRNVCQQGIHFDVHGVFEVKGSWAQGLKSRTVVNIKICHL